MQNENSTVNIQILTPSGYQPFSGVARWWHDNVIDVKFIGGLNKKCAPNHRFIVGCSEKFAKDLKPGDEIGKYTVDYITDTHDPQWLYDPTNVSNGEIYIHDDGLISHNSFMGASSTLIDGAALIAMRAQNPIVEYANTKIYEEPIKDHSYIMAVDVAKGRGQDFSTFSIFDVTKKPYKQVVTFRDSLISPLIFPDIIYRIARKYNDAYVIVESNDSGQLVFKSVYYDYEYPHMFMGVVKNGRSMGLEMNRKTKRIGCSHLKDLIESRTLEIIDMETIAELSVFEAHGDSWAARQGCHDDMVMGLVGFSWFASTPQFNEITKESLKSIMGAERERLIDDSVPFFGQISTKMVEAQFEQIIDRPDKRIGYRFDDVFGKDFGVAFEEFDEKDLNQAQKYLF